MSLTLLDVLLLLKFFVLTCYDIDNRSKVGIKFALLSLGIKVPNYWQLIKIIRKT
jgi:hypothetical protein